MKLKKRGSTAKKGLNGVGVFFISMTISFILLSSTFMMFYIVSQKLFDKEATANKKDVPFDNTYADHIFRTEENLTTLVIGCDEITSLPTLFLLCKYNAIDGNVTTTVLPPQTVITVQTRKATLVEHYDYEGILGATRAVKSLTLSPVDRYIRFDKTGIANIFDFLGGVNFNIEKPFTIKEYNFQVGKQSLDGKRIAQILLKPNETNEDLILKNQLISSFLKEHFNASLIEKFSSFQSAFFYNATTNINQYDFAFRQKGIFNRLSSESLVIKDEIIQGVFKIDNDVPVFEPAEQKPPEEPISESQAIKEE